MNSKRWVVCAALLSCLVIGAVGCKKEEAARADTTAAEPAAESAAGMKTAEVAAPPAAVAPADPAGQAQPAEPAAGDEARDVVALGAGGKAKVLPTGGKVIADKPTYKLMLAAPGKVGKGAQASVVLEILPKEGWKLNKEFPTKLTVVEPAGVKVSKKEQTVADAVAFADKSGKWSVDFQADSSGAKAFTGQI
jgi:hypothetical protein